MHTATLLEQQKYSTLKGISNGIKPHILRVGCAGAGRAGKVHIEILLGCRDVKLIAICTPDELEQEWARQAAPYAQIFPSYESFMAYGSRDGKMECVWINTPTGLHKEHVSQALRHGMHVFCEKPLSDNPQSAAEIYEESLKYPELKVACGFPRRFDRNYVEARRRIQEGAIGDIISFHSQTTDLLDTSDFFLRYAKGSGGIFVDSAIHCIDSALYLISPAIVNKEAALQPLSAYATGNAFVLPKVADWGDADNAQGLVSFTNGIFGHFTCSRTNAHGHHSSIEVVGTKGKIYVNREPSLLNVEISDVHGTRMQAARDHFDLFKDAFAFEDKAFLDWTLYDKEPDFSMFDAALAVKVGCALQQSLKGRSLVLFK